MTNKFKIDILLILQETGNDEFIVKYLSSTNIVVDAALTNRFRVEFESRAWAIDFNSDGVAWFCFDP